MNERDLRDTIRKEMDLHFKRHSNLKISTAYELLDENWEYIGFTSYVKKCRIRSRLADYVLASGASIICRIFQSGTFDD